MILLIVILIIGIIAFIFGMIIGYHEDSKISNVFVFFGTLIMTMSMVSIAAYDKPTALDVYRGKTTIQITYEDSVPTDTVVVFKR